MEITKGKISAFQFFVMLFLSRTLTTVTYLSSYTESIRLSDMLIQPIFRIIIGTLIMLPVYFLYKKHENKNLLEIINCKSKVFAKLVSVLFVLYFFYFTVVTIARLDLFAGTIVFPETDVDYMLVMAIILCCYGAYLGFEALGRSSVLSAVLVVPALIFIMLTLVKKVDFLNLTPIFYNGVMPVVKVAVDSVGQTVEYAIIALMLPRVTGNMKKGFFLWLISQTLLMAVMFFFATAVMGNFASTQLFPFHTMASLAEFSMFTRLDAIFTSVWIMCAFIKAGLLIFLQAEILATYFSKFKRIHYLIVIGIITILANLLISQQVEWFTIIDSSTIKIIITGISVVIIPSIVFFICRKGNDKCEKQV
ncbi:MAG: GerAB/ArcD/ProY family transporter [Clostridia bacterium]|nr:GerAB/ArcD/ProY family transporter [Clostridia bacterium]